MEKRVLVAIALTVGLFYAYLLWFAPKPDPRRARVAQGTAAQVRQGTGQAESPDGQSAAARGRAPLAGDEAGADQTVTNGALDMVFAARGATLREAQVWSCSYHDRKDGPVEGDPGRPSDPAGGVQAGAFGVDLLGVPDLPDLTASAWTLTPAGDGLRAEIAAGGLLFWKQITVSRDSAHPWHADVTVGIRNVSAAAGAARTLEVVGPATPRPNPLFIDDGVLLESAGESPEELTVQGVQELLAENPRLEKRPPTGKWSWIGVRSGFHAAALLPLDPLPADTTVGLRMVGVTEPGHGVRPVVAPTFRLPVTIPQPGSEATFRFRMFAGPNQRSLFTEDGSPYAVLRGVTVNRKFLWMSFQPLSNLLAWLLKILADTGMGYGMAVIALTVLVRGVLFPLSRKSQVSMRLHGLRMGRLKPKLDAIKEKYKDPKKQQEMTMKLFREEKVSLLPGGCLLIFLQMPIWISLYSVLQTTYEMRHASFLWAADLTAPDHLLHLPFFANVPLVPEWLNLLPLLMMLTWTWSSLMQPLPPDPQQAQQAKIMRWMPLLFGFFLYSTASGLTLYMTMSAIWSIGETTLIKKVWLAKIDKSLA